MATGSNPTRLRVIGRRTLLYVKVLACYHLWDAHCYSLRPCLGPSMIPTLRVRGDGLWISRRYAYGRGIERGDVISLHSPMMRGVSVVKRVLGMPGDFVLRDTPGPAGDRMIQVPDGHCWVVGDNVSGSVDSRHWGPVPLALVRGKVLLRCRWTWPFFSRIENSLTTVSEGEPNDGGD